jgi:predicted amidophosphoribosyltransferase
MALDFILRFFQLGTCIICGRYNISDKGLCPICDQRIFRSQGGSLQEKILESFPVYSLYEWIPGLSDDLSHWILSLKRAPMRKWNHLAEEFMAKRLREPGPQSLKTSSGALSKILLLPCPNGDPSRRHALNWAQALAKVGQFPIQESLSVPKARIGSERFSQKQRSREERRFIRFHLNENITDPRKGDSYIFVDDIVTTGSTALAAWKALGRPQNFQVWCVAIRPRLRT